MQIGEVCLMTRDVKKISDFYKWLLGIGNGSDDTEHQFLISEGTALTVCRDYGEGEIGHGGICLAFTVDDVDAEHERLVSRGVEVLY